MTPFGLAEFVGIARGPRSPQLFPHMLYPLGYKRLQGSVPKKVGPIILHSTSKSGAENYARYRLVEEQEVWGPFVQNT